jgi:hypothetical protein
MATSEQMARGVQIMRDVREEFPALNGAGQRAIAPARWKAVEREVAQMRRRPR